MRHTFLVDGIVYQLDIAQQVFMKVPSEGGYFYIDTNTTNPNITIDLMTLDEWAQLIRISRAQALINQRGASFRDRVVGELIICKSSEGYDLHKGARWLPYDPLKVKPIKEREIYI